MERAYLTEPLNPHLDGRCWPLLVFWPKTILGDGGRLVVSRLETHLVPTEHWSRLVGIAAHLQVAKDTILRWIQRKSFSACHAGQMWRFKVSEVDDWMCSGKGAETLFKSELRPA